MGAERFSNFAQVYTVSGRSQILTWAIWFKSLYVGFLVQLFKKLSTISNIF